MENTKYKILLIEDDKLDQKAFERLVENEKLPYDYMIAGSISEAQSILGSERFDVVVSDYSLGDGTAFDVLDLVKNTPFILVTGTGNEEVAVKAWKAGAYDYLTKDLDRNYLKTVPITVENAIKRKKAEEEIHRLSHAIEQSPSTVVITDTRGDIEYINPEFTRLTGYTLEEVKGKNLRILESIEQTPELHKELWEAITSGREWRGEFHNKKKNGGFYWEFASISAITNSEGAITGFLKVAEDITERKQIHEILDRKQKNLEAIFDAAPVGMMLIDENMIVKRVNNVIKQMVGREYPQIINQRSGGALSCINSTYDEKGCGYSPACAACLLRKTVESALDSEQSVHEVEVQPTLKVGNKEITPWLSISAEPTMIDGCKHVVIAINDITERKQAEEKLKEAMEIKSQFISTVSHELRTPLASMKEGIAIVLDGIAGEINNEQKNFLNIAKRNLDRLASLINDVLDFQRLEAGKMRLNIQENDINDVVGEVQKTMLPSAKKNGMDIVLELDDKLPKARFDRDKIIQVLTNLINNAIKFTPEQGQVSVCVRQQDEELVIRVNDTGMGIPKDALPKIFDRFYRVYRPGKQIGGTGLGLSIVKKIVMMHGGRIEVESEVDKGTTFTIFLPLAAEFIPEALSTTTDELMEDSLVNNQARTK